MRQRFQSAIGALSFSLALAGMPAHAASPLTVDPETAVNVSFHNIPVVAESISLHFERHDLDRVGQLIFMGGIEIKSNDRRFGGLSGLKVSPDGHALLAVSDHGSWVGATIDYHDGRLVGVHDLLIAPLLDPDGHDLVKLAKAEGDAEAVAELPGSGLIVSFEGDHRLWHYGASLTDAMQGKRPLPLPLPLDVVQSIAQLPPNGGIEALTTLRDGSLLAIAESGLDEQRHTLKGWRISEKGIRTIAYRAHDNFKPTDLATLPNGDVLVLERRFTLLQGLSSRVKRIKAAALDTDAPLEGEIVATLAFPYNIDNMEGLAVRQDDAGHTLVYMVSDDNFNPLQRTLLMMFRLDDTPKSAPQAPSAGVIIATGE